MASVIEEFFYGNVRPNRPKKETQHEESARLREIIHGELMSTLNEEEKDLFDKFCCAQEELNEFEQIAQLAWGLKFGVMLMAEVFTGSGEVLGREE